MRQSAQYYILSCGIYEDRKNPPRKRRYHLKLFFIGEPFERIAIDITGPFRKSMKGYSHFLLVADYLTKFMEIFPLVNIDAETVAEGVFKGWIKSYGYPGEIHSVSKPVVTGLLPNISNRNNPNNPISPTIRWNGRATKANN